jgi:hypothetical protein
MDTVHPAGDAGERLRLLEHWLPLAQEANEQHGWGLEASALEALILAAAPALGDAGTTLAARATLWACHRELHAKGRLAGL